MPQGGVATVEQRLCSGGAMGRGVFRVRGGDAWVDGVAGVVGCLKGKAGDLGQLVSARGSENRGGELGWIPLRERGKREEEDKTDRWVRGRSERGGAGLSGLGARLKR